ncbi:MAG: hypothetical protein AAFZ80_08345 [Cyanobacteria bacterium P01_A01_bin.105]
MKDRAAIAAYLFIVGSALFVMDALVGLVQQPDWLAYVRLGEGLAFLAGSWFFLPAPKG